jgi:hypothetical protein
VYVRACARACVRAWGAWVCGCGCVCVCVCVCVPSVIFIQKANIYKTYLGSITLYISTWQLCNRTDTTIFYVKFETACRTDLRKIFTGAVILPPNAMWPHLLRRRVPKFREKSLFYLSVKYKVVQIWPGLIVCKQVTVCPGHIWTTLYMFYCKRTCWFSITHHCFTRLVTSTVCTYVVAKQILALRIIMNTFLVAHYQSLNISNEVL